tara:strand:- start:37 stop:240 length:204 start_codon:yes stop_codon:yes gene_type:complete
MYYNIIYKDDEALEIVNEISAHMFQNKDGSINQKVLGMYVHEWAADRVVMSEGKLLICRTIEEAKIV